MPLLYEPCPNVSVIAGHDADQAFKLVHTLDRDVDALAADFPNECAFHALPALEPVAVLMLGLLIPCGCIKPGNSHFRSGYPYPVARGHVSLARYFVGGAPDMTAERMWPNLA